MAIEVATLSEVIRFHPTQQSAHDHGPFDASVIVQYLSRDEAFLCALAGQRMRRNYRDELSAYLLSRGITTARAERHGRIITYEVE